MYAIYANRESSLLRGPVEKRVLSAQSDDRQSSPSTSILSPTSMPHVKRKNRSDESKLQHAVDILLRAHHDKLPPPNVAKRPLRVDRRDSFSTITTDPETSRNVTACSLKVVERNGGFVPIEISFPSSEAHSFPLMPKMQKSKGTLPDWMDVCDFYDEDSCEDIVFVPVEGDLATRSSSMEVIRKLSIEPSSSQEGQKSDKKGEQQSPATVTRPRLRRSHSQGLEPPSMPGMHVHQMPFGRCRVEI